MTGLLPGDVVHKAAMEALYRVDARCEAEGWDVPPRLFLVRAVDGQANGRPAVMFRLDQLHAFTHAVGQGWPPAKALSAIADGLRAGRSSPLVQAILGVVGPNSYGWLAVTEAWMVGASTDDPAAVEALQAEARARRLHAHPCRAEVRGLYLACIDGGQTSLLHERDGVVRDFSTYGLGSFRRADRRWEGDVWDALASMCETIRDYA